MKLYDLTSDLWINWTRGPHITSTGHEEHYIATGETGGGFRIFSGLWIEENGEVRIEDIAEE